MCQDLPSRCCGPVVLLMILGAIAPSGCVRRVVSVEEVDKTIRDQVPIGSDKEKAKAFIDNLRVDSLRIVHGEFHNANREAVGNLDPEKVAELRYRVAEFIGARICDAQSGFLNHNDIAIQFYLDRHGRMIGYAVKMEGEE